MSKGNKRVFIRIYNEFMKDDRFDSRDHFIYALIKGLSYQRYDGVSILSTEAILATIGFTVTSRNKSYVKESLQKLLDAELIEVYDDFTCMNKISSIPLSSTFFCKQREENGHFMKLYIDDFHKFISLDNKYKMKIFTVYYTILSRIYDSISSDAYTMIGIDEIVSLTGVNRKTVPKYVSILAEEELMYCKKIRIAKDKEKNIYCRWESRDVVDTCFE